MKKTRSFIHIHGQLCWSLDTTKKLFLQSDNKSCKIIHCGFEDACFDDENTITVDNTKKRSEIEHHLGTEYLALIYNCFNGFNPELFCALAGLIKAPGVIVLITPDIKLWPAYADPDYSKFCSFPYTPENIKGRYITYLIHKLTEYSESKCFITLAQCCFSKQALSSTNALICTIFNETTSDHKKIITPNSEQNFVIASIEKLASAEDNGVVAVYGNRGRGKSTAIGIALQNIILNPNNFEPKIIVVSQK